MSLQTLILARIAREGAIPFATYMQMALYEPDYGYYVSGPARMGWEGDYFTSSDVSNFFAHCLGRQLLQLWQQSGEPAQFSVLEQGAGRGNLAQGVQLWVEQEQPDFYKALKYQTADIRAGQDVHTTTNSPTTEKIHVILSNELVDAFPVHIVEKRGEQLYELYVDAQDGRLHEVLGEPSSVQVATYLDAYKIPWRTYADGWRAEINLAVEQWLDQSVNLLMETPSRRKKSGFLLVIDYGDKARELYTPYRPQGTLSSYYQHQLTERPFSALANRILPPTSTSVHSSQRAENVVSISRPTPPSANGLSTRASKKNRHSYEHESTASSTQIEPRTRARPPCSNGTTSASKCRPSSIPTAWAISKSYLCNAN